MRVRSILAAVAAITSFSCPAFASLIVDFTGDLANTGTNIAKSLSGTTGTNAGVLSSVTAFSDNAANGLDVAGFPKLTVASSYYATGALEAGTRQLGYRVTDSPDRLQFQFNPAKTIVGANDTAASFDALMLIYSQDFAALAGQQVKFDESSFIKFGKPSVAGVTGLNIVVKNGGVFYMNTTNWIGTTGAQTLSNLPATNWVSFDPTANGGDIASLASATSGGTTVTFDNVQAVGFFFEGATTTTASRTVAFNNWTVEASAVPEPGIMALLGGSVAFGLLGRRKHA